MSCANKAMTNNLAEYQGLLHGLRHARRNKWYPLHVIGDSAMIIAQHKNWRPPWHKVLKNLYKQMSRLAMAIPVQSWS